MNGSLTYRWEVRTIDLDTRGAILTPQYVFEGLIRASSELGDVWLDSARVSLIS